MSETEHPVGVYRHYKGGLYRVHSYGFLEATMTPVVIYESIEQNADLPSGTYFVRPLEEFFETVVGDIPRFTYQTQYENWIL